MRMNGRKGADDVVTRILTGNFEVESRKTWGFSLLQNIQTDSGTHLAPSADNGGSFVEAKLAGE